MVRWGSWGEEERGSCESDCKEESEEMVVE